MPRYFMNYEELTLALKKTKSADEALSICKDLETRMCPMHWVNAARKRFNELI